ncbi:unnamed protein product [Ciceribacter selenitireducens ATCC BAA-1503]|uniref:Uncharacterized protein n=1 Tax=Ciceribacter selenitireducens ATCC BAA-1503 TaxID=1336235 RepID=A0A376ALU1_9HYPH|nr:unnamed protein product [Ciceribacter selenitireducens ATCC BAA-1503]
MPVGADDLHRSHALSPWKNEIRLVQVNACTVPNANGSLRCCNV